MTKIFCDRCNNEIKEEVEEKIEYIEGAYGAVLTKVTRYDHNDNKKGFVLRPAAFGADLCLKCQTELNNVVIKFMSNES